MSTPITNADAPNSNPVQPAAPTASGNKRPVSYERRLKKLDDRQLLAEVQKQTRSETQRRNYHGVALGTVLALLLKSHAKGAPTLG